MAGKAKRKLQKKVLDDPVEEPTVSRRERKKRKVSSSLPSYERHGAREFLSERAAPALPMPTVSAEGKVSRASKRFIVAHKKKDQVPQPEPEEPKPTPIPDKPQKKESKTLDGVPFSEVRAKLASWASKLVSAPEENVGLLKDLRKFSASNKGRAAALSILTEAQVYKDLAPAYRIRTISEKEAETTVSKDVAKLRSYEQAFLNSYVRFVRSIGALTRSRVGAQNGPNTTMSKKTDLLVRARRAACTAAAELLKALPHFNEADALVEIVCALTSDREEALRKEAANSLRSVLGEAHRASGPTLATCVTIAKKLSEAATVKSSIVSAETIEPMLGIKFASFPLLPIGKKEVKKKGNFKGKNKKVNQRNAAKQAKEESAKAQFNRENETQVMRDLREADAEPTPQEMFAARKMLLDAVCRALFNVIHLASRTVEQAKDSGNDGSGKKRKPPPALAPALHGLLRVTEYISIDIVEAILAALGPLLDSQRLPLQTRLRCLSAAYAILAQHAITMKASDDTVTADARDLDRALYAAANALYARGTPLKASEDVTTEFTRALAAATGFREMPVARAAAFARRLGISAAASAPTHASSLALLAAMQFVAPRRVVSCVFASRGTEGDATEFVQEFATEIEDPDAAGAQHSGAWELAAMAHHYHPTVREVADAIAEMSKQPAAVDSVVQVPALVKKYTSEGGGFNPPPVAKWEGKKKNRRRSRLVEQDWIEDEDEDNGIGDDYAEELWKRRGSKVSK